MSNVFTSILANGLTVTTYLSCLFFAFACGAIVALAAAFHSRVTKSYLISLILLPAIVATVIIMVNGSVGTGIAVAGAFSLVRFRSVPGKAKEIAGLFLTMSAGLACAAGYVSVALLFTVITSAVMLIVSLIPISGEQEMELRITVPESLNYEEAFDEVLKQHTKSYRLSQVRTTNMGSLYRLDYRIVLKDPKQSREMIDELRCRNGNLEIRITVAPERVEDL